MECFPSMHKALGQLPGTTNKQGTVMSVYNPSTPGVEARRSKSSVGLRATLRPASKTRDSVFKPKGKKKSIDSKELSGVVLPEAPFSGTAWSPTLHMSTNEHSNTPSICF